VRGWKFATESVVAGDHESRWSDRRFHARSHLEASRGKTLCCEYFIGTLCCESLPKFSCLHILAIRSCNSSQLEIKLVSAHCMSQHIVSAHCMSQHIVSAHCMSQHIACLSTSSQHIACLSTSSQHIACLSTSSQHIVSAHRLSSMCGGLHT
jgi:hypothetical protein